MSESRNSRALQRFLETSAKRQPIILVCLGQAIPMLLKTVCELHHLRMKPLDLAHGSQIVSVSLVLGQTDNFAITQLNEQGDVTLANRPAQITAARQNFGLRQ